MTVGGTTGGAAPLRILVTVTFNPNQLRSHLLPVVALQEVASVTLVADSPTPSLPKLRTVVPPRWLMRLLGRAGAKLVVCAWLAVRERPDWIVGFNFVPHGFNARVAAGLIRSKSIYHMIGGESEWLGGGWQSDNRLLALLPRPSALLEGVMVRLIADCTVVATMGEAGRAALVSRGVEGSRIRVLPPSVDTDRFRRPSDQPSPLYDVVTVGALIERKRMADVLRALGLVSTRRPGIRAAIVGEGPLEAELRALAASLQLGDAVDFMGFRRDIEDVYADARIFVLASSSEGLPVAMLEAMSAGLPPVVSEVGETGGFVRNGENGFLFPSGDVEALAEALETLLGDESLQQAVGLAAASEVRARASVAVVAEGYRQIFSAQAPRQAG